jgi:hypothetical protein
MRMHLRGITSPAVSVPGGQPVTFSPVILTFMAVSTLRFAEKTRKRTRMPGGIRLALPTYDTSLLGFE